jgi:hypothetical protein
MRYQRAAMLDVIRQDYVRTARAKGLSETKVVLKHAWRNALIPIITLLGYVFVILVEGSIVVETIFSWPGMGLLAVDSLQQRDYPVVMDIVLLSSIMILLGVGGQKLFTTNSVQVWDIKAEKAIATLNSPGGRSWPFAHFAFLPKSNDLLVALDSSLEVWSPATGAKRTIAAADTFEGDAIQHSRILDDGLLVTARADGRVCLCDLEKA